MFFYQLTPIPGWSSLEAVRVQEQLGEGVDGDESLEIAMGRHKVHNGLDLRLRVSPGSTVVASAGVITGTRTYT